MLTLLLAVSLPAQALDTAAYQSVLSQHTGAGLVDYAAIKASGALDGYVEGLATATEPAGRSDRMAFWINAYNALTIDLIADNYPLSSIMDLDGGKVWDTRKFTVAGRQVSLNDIEHEIIRPMGDARIHAAVNCASQGCPPLQSTVFTGAALDSQLAAATTSWMKGNGLTIDRSANTVAFNQIFDWYGEDFTGAVTVDIPGVDGKLEAAASFAAGYVSEDDAAWLRAGGYQASFGSYSWKLNAR